MLMVNRPWSSCARPSIACEAAYEMHVCTDTSKAIIDAHGMAGSNHGTTCVEDVMETIQHMRPPSNRACLADYPT